MQLGVGVVVATLIALAAWRAHTLTLSGALAAAVIGAVTFGIGGFPAALVLLAFFLPSTVLSRVGKVRKRALVDIGKQGARDAWQVLANGGVASVAIVLSLRGSNTESAAMMAAYAGAFAAASADTWGTEIGTLAQGRPRSILTMQPLETGMSGGVTLVGTLAEIAGALVVAFAAALVHIGALWPVACAGIVGAFVDSVLGASAQAMRYCPACTRDCETNPHICGTPSVIRRGFGWLGNDAVNAAATLTGGASAYLFFAYVFSR